jgi:hypothetical protein
VRGWVRSWRVSHAPGRARTRFLSAAGVGRPLGLLAESCGATVL